MTDTTPDPDLPGLLSQTEALRGMVRALIHNESETDDILQETQLAAMSPGRSLRQDQGGWLRGTARNVVRHWIRSRTRRLMRERMAARKEAVAGAAEVVVQTEALRLVVDAVLALPEPYRTAVALRYLRGLPPRRMAEVLDVPVATAKSQVRRGLVLLRKRLDDHHGGDRHAWVVSLLPFAGGAVRSALTAALATILAGVVIMKTKIAALACLLTLALGVCFVLRPQDIDERCPPGGREQEHSALGSVSAAETGASSTIVANVPSTHTRQDEPIARPNERHTYTLAIEVADSNGVPLPSVLVAARMARWSTSAMTDANGTAVLGLPGPGLAAIDAVWADQRESRDTISILPDVVTRAQLQFAPRMLLRIVVQNGAGVRLSGAQVRLCEQSPIVPFQRTCTVSDTELMGTTDDEGVANITYVPGAPAYIQVTKAGYYAGTVGIRTSQRPVQEQVMTMAAGEMVQATVVDAETHEPIPLIPVRINLDEKVIGPPDQGIGILIADESGHIAFARPVNTSATYGIHGTPHYHGFGSIPEHETSVVIEAKSCGIMLCRPILYGRVISDDCIIDYDVTWRYEDFTEAGERGADGVVMVHYQGQVTSPAFRIRVPGVGCSDWRYQRKRLPVAPINLAIKPSLRLTGRTVDAVTGKPIANLLVDVAEVRGTSFSYLGGRWAREGASSVTAADGTFASVLPPDGQCELRIFGGAEYGDYCAIIGPRLVGDIGVGDISMWPGATLALSVSMDGKPEPFCYGWLVRRPTGESGPDTFRRLFRTDHNGCMSVDGLSPGRYFIMLSGPMRTPPESVPGSFGGDPSVVVHERGTTTHVLDIHRR